jgi:hypothetical protein
MMLVSFTNGGQLKAQRIPNSITIHDNQYSCINSMEYFIIDSSLSIGYYSEEGDLYDSGYIQDELVDTVLTKTQIHAIDYFMKHFPFDSLAVEYESGADKICDSTRQIHIEINWKDRKKDIQIVDCYQKDMRRLFDMINTLIAKDKPRKSGFSNEMLKFDYRPEQFECHK